jgi:hypothetical protein
MRLSAMDRAFAGRLRLAPFEFAKGEPETNRIDDKTSSKDKRHHHFLPPEIANHRFAS